jgi:cellulose biosynthesis protein BcsQ
MASGMKVLSFFNNKGGVGKTTLTCNLAAHLAKKNHGIIVIDADPQCNAAILTLGEDRAVPPLLGRRSKRGASANKQTSHL